MTGSMQQALDETNRRRAKQVAYNTEHGITPQSIVKAVDMQLAAVVEADYITVPLDAPELDNIADEEGMRQAMAQLETQMREAAAKFEFERAAQIRDRLRALKQKSLSELFSLPAEPEAATAAATSPPAAPAGSGPQPVAAAGAASRPHPRRKRA